AEDKADASDIGIGIYGGSFMDLMNIRWTIRGGMQEYKTERHININGQSYAPQGKFDTYSIRSNVELEFNLFENDRAINLTPFIGMNGGYVINKDIEETGGGVANLIVKADNNLRLTAVAGIRLQGDIAKTKWRIDFSGGYIIDGGDDLTYDVLFKEAQEYGAMKIRAVHEAQEYASGLFVLEKEITDAVSLYGRAGIELSLDRKEDIVTGYNAGLGLSIKFGAKMTQEELDEQLRREKEKRDKLLKEAEDKQAREATKRAQEIAALAEAEALTAEEAARRAEAERLAAEGKLSIEEPEQFAPIEDSEKINQNRISVEETETAEILKQENMPSQISEEEKEMIDKANERRSTLKQTFKLSAATFKSGSAALTPQSKADIKKIAQTLKKYEFKTLTVEGHTDSSGRVNENKEISRKRASVVMDELAANGIPIEKMKSEGFGSLMPIAPNDTPLGKEMNRRVEIFVE
ncbi:MAG: OmpA family protein, partial [Endomicrobium sp.]|nr:OmpA family protein [Endomicrobium sp.]